MNPVVTRLLNANANCVVNMGVKVFKLEDIEKKFLLIILTKNNIDIKCIANVFF